MMQSWKSKVSLNGELESITMMDLRSSPGDVFDAVELGKAFIVTRHGKPTAVISKLPGEELGIKVDGSQCQQPVGEGMKSTPKLEAQLKKYESQGILVSRTENNKYLQVSYRGAGGLVPEKWNVKIYTSGSVVCVDMKLLHDIINDKLAPPDNSKKVLSIDDAGWGFVLCGAAVGVSDNERVEVDFVDVSFFQGPAFSDKEYLREYTRKGYKLLIEKFKADPETHRIEICSGYLNQRLRSFLREKGFDVRVVEIKGLLQDRLEDLFRQHVVDTVGRDLAYDPKELRDSKKIARKYREVLEWGKVNCPYLLKTGWFQYRSSRGEGPY